MEAKKNDKSLYIYTAMIFIAAIIMIVVSFFAQHHLEQLKASEVEAVNVTLSHKAAQVSEENMQLVENNKVLNNINKSLTEENQALALEKEILKKEKSGYEALIGVYKLIVQGDVSAAEKKLKGIYTQDLSSEQKEIYDFLVKEIQ